MDTQRAAAPGKTPMSVVGTPANSEAQPGTTDIRNAVTSIVGASVAALLPQKELLKKRQTSLTW